MNAKVYEYGEDPNTGLKRRLIQDVVTIQRKRTWLRRKPRVVVRLRLQTYVEIDGKIEVSTRTSTGYDVIEGVVSKDVNGKVLPKYIYEFKDGQLIRTPVLDPEGNPEPRDNGYDNIMFLATLPVPSDSILDSGIREYYNIEE